MRTLCRRRYIRFSRSPWRAAWDAGAVDVGAEGLVVADLLPAAVVLRRLLLLLGAHAECAAERPGRGLVEPGFELLECRRFLPRRLRFVAAGCAAAAGLVRDHRRRRVGGQ